jgi:hypothetical protein
LIPIKNKKKVQIFHRKPNFSCTYPNQTTKLHIIIFILRLGQPWMLQRFSSTGPLARVNLQQLLHEIQIKHITGLQPMLQIGHLRYQDLNLASFDLLPRIIAQVWIVLALAIIQIDLPRLTPNKNLHLGTTTSLA